jgi:hypothetical protein
MGTAIIRYPARAVGLMEIEHLQHFSDTLTIVPIRRVARDACRWRSVDRNSFRSPRGVRYSQECSTPSARFNLCENCYNPVYASCRGLNPSAMRGEARLRGLYRIIYSKTISPRLSKAKSACAGYIRLFLQRPSARCGARRWNALAIQARVNVSENCYKSAMRLVPSGSWRLRIIAVLTEVEPGGRD